MKTSYRLIPGPQDFLLRFDDHCPTLLSLRPSFNSSPHKRAHPPRILGSQLWTSHSTRTSATNRWWTQKGRQAGQCMSSLNQPAVSADELIKDIWDGAGSWKKHLHRTDDSSNPLYFLSCYFWQRQSEGNSFSLSDRTILIAFGTGTQLVRSHYCDRV